MWLVLAVVALSGWFGWLAFNQGDGRSEVAALWGGVGLALCCFALSPSLSDDYHRYLFEGFATISGYSPYQHAPASLYEVLDHPSEGLVNHASYTAIYPPLAQGLFALSASLSPHLWAWKLIVFLAFALFFAVERDARLWLLGPLLCVEGFWNAHLDVLGLIPLYYMVRFLEAGRGTKAGVMLALCISLKYLPLLFFPFGLMHLKGSERWRFVLATFVTGLVIFAPYLPQLPSLFVSFRAFAGQWHFNNPVFHGLSALGFANLARPIMGLGLLAGLGIIAWRMKELRMQCFAVWYLLLWTSPTVYPWYLLWLLPLVRGRQVLLVQVLFVACSWSYWVLVDYRASGVWQESWWWMAAEWLVMVVAMIAILKPPPKQIRSLES